MSCMMRKIISLKLKSDTCSSGFIPVQAGLHSSSGFTAFTYDKRLEISNLEKYINASNEELGKHSDVVVGYSILEQDPRFDTYRRLKVPFSKKFKAPNSCDNLGSSGSFPTCMKYC